MTYYSIDYNTARALRRAMADNGGASEVAAVDRLEQFRGRAVDCDRLRPWARDLGVTLPDEVFSTLSEEE